MVSQEGWLYVFAGFPGKDSAENRGLGSKGLQEAFCACEDCFERRGTEPFEPGFILEHDNTICYRKEGVCLAGKPGEIIRSYEHRISDMLLMYGITWDWFLPNSRFGNGITRYVCNASPDYRTVISGTDMTLENFKRANRGTPYRESDLLLVDEHWRNESWTAYEARWESGKCPQVAHRVHLTWLVTTHKLPEFAYERLRDIIEYGAEPEGTYRPEHFNNPKIWNGKIGWGRS